MRCVGCAGEPFTKAGWERHRRQRHCCSVCGRRQTERSASAFCGYGFPDEIIVLTVRWHLRLYLSYANVAKLLSERGIHIDPTDTPLLTLAQVGAARWGVETRLQTGKGETAWPSMTCVDGQAWHHHVTLCLLSGTSLPQVQQDWGETLPQFTRPQICRTLRARLPQSVWIAHDVLAWLVGIRGRNERTKLSQGSSK